MKHCPICDEDKPLSEFGKHRREADGLRYCCRACNADRASDWQARNAEKAAARKRKWYEEHRELTKQRAREWYEVNREQARETRRRYYEAHRFGWPTRSHRSDDLIASYARVLSGDPCSYCGTVPEQIDHIVPLARGGDHAWDNLTAACGHCNTSKHARPLLSFLWHRSAIVGVVRPNW